MGTPVTEQDVQGLVYQAWLAERELALAGETVLAALGRLVERGVLTQELADTVAAEIAGPPPPALTLGEVLDRGRAAAGSS